MAQKNGNFVLLATLLLIPLHLVSAQCEARINKFGEYRFGRIDDTTLLRYLTSANATDLYTHKSGLYLLPHNITVEGHVDTICMFGYVRHSFLHLLLNEDGRFDFQTNVRAFAYMIHYRPLIKDPTTYRMVSKPALVYHDLREGCVSDHDGLDWQVQRGDEIGVFIPDNCSSWDQLLDVNVYSKDFNGKLLCAYYLNVSLAELAEIREEEFTYEETVLNIEVVINPYSNTLALLVSGSAIAVLFLLLCTITTVTLCCALCCKKNKLKNTSKQEVVSSEDLEDPHIYEEIPEGDIITDDHYIMKDSSAYGVLPNKNQEDTN